jgi:prevent-host-death family protein
MLTRRISVKEARSNFSDLLGSVRYSGDPVIVEKKGRPFAVMISPEDFERFQAVAKERFFETARAIQQDNKDADPEQVLADVTEAVEAVRQEEYADKTTRRT